MTMKLFTKFLSSGWNCSHLLLYWKGKKIRNFLVNFVEIFILVYFCRFLFNVFTNLIQRQVFQFEFVTVTFRLRKVVLARKSVHVLSASRKSLNC
jgi:hypothetical protein